jgi:hypothetical protein
MRNFTCTISVVDAKHHSVKIVDIKCKNQRTKFLLENGDTVEVFDSQIMTEGFIHTIGVDDDYFLKITKEEV